MFKVVLLAFLAAYAAADNVHPREYYQKLFFEHLNKFKLEFKNGSEFVQKLQTFANNIDTIEKHNADTTQTFKMGANQFTHLTYDEWQDEVKVGIRIPNLRRTSAQVHAEPADRASLPTTVDWTAAGAVTPVKNQGSCGSCWSFSTTGALEGAYQIKYGTLKSFSEQELVSCDNGGQDHGCNGGWMDNAFDWVSKNGGITTEDQYPYTSGNGQTGTCKKTGYTNDPKVAPTKHVDVQTKSVSALMSAVAQQPVSIAIEADQPAFQHYSSGVLTSGCGQNLDHGVLLVGYGTESGTDYWKVKNSWGTSWGEQGYIKIARSSADLCGVLDAPSYPVL